MRSSDLREKCIRIFPDEKSCFRLFGAILQGYSEDWISGKLYLSEPMERIKETLKKPTPFEATRDGLEPCLSRLRLLRRAPARRSKVDYL
jgi:hypothetical protein